MRVTIYVPRPGSGAASHLLPGSAVVADPTREADGMLTCWYEGNVGNRAINLRDFYSRLCCAAGRLVSSYPTTALSGFPVTDLIPVGVFDADRNVVLEIFAPETLVAWCGEGVGDVTGMRLPPGAAAWADAARVTQPPHSSLIGRQDPSSATGLWFRTQAGQIVRFIKASGEAEVFDHNDPRLLGLLAPLGLDATCHRTAFGDGG